MQITFEVIWKLIGALGGFAFIVAGLSAWLGKIWAERILEKDRSHYQRELETLRSRYEAMNKAVQSDLDRRIHVYRIQFETEFKALTEIWERTMELRSEIFSLRPGFDVDTPEGEDEIEKYRKRLPTFHHAVTALKESMFKYSPFYPTDIYEQLMSLVKIAGYEEFMVRTACHKGSIPDNWLEQGEKNQNEYNKVADSVSKAIRERIGALSIIP